jgi:hypothetical protein
MSSLLATFIVSCVALTAIIALKVREVSMGRRLILSGFRGVVDHLTDTLPVIFSRQIRLMLARTSLQLHEVTRLIHDGVGSTRGFFRRFTIKLFASAHSQTPVARETPPSPFWQRITGKVKTNLTRE